MSQELEQSREAVSGAQPTVRMPQPNQMTHLDRLTALHRQDSGICSDLNRLSIRSEPEEIIKGVADLPSEAAPEAKMIEDYFEPDEDGDAHIHLAIAAGSNDIAVALINAAPDPSYLSIQNKRHLYSPLHLAVLQNQPALVRALVVHGAAMNLCDKDGNTPLHLAAIRGNVQCGEALLRPVSIHEMPTSSSGAPMVLAQQNVAELVDRCNFYGETCVHLAAMGGHCAFLQFLCWNNADMDAQEGRGGRTGLHFAVGARNLAAVQCLVEAKPNGCGANVGAVDWCGRTPFQLACLNRSLNISNYLSARMGGLNGPLVLDDSSTYSDPDSECEEWGSTLLLDSSA